jgi:phage-related protein (TIGR01555 family)
MAPGARRRTTNGQGDSAPQGVIVDHLMNVLSGLGTDRDKISGTRWQNQIIAKDQLDAAYRGDWISRKGVDIPAFDTFREWRSWQADKQDISLLENTEKSLFIRRKLTSAMIKGRLYGGGLLILGVNQGNPDEELIIENVRKGDLKFVHPVTRFDVSNGKLIWDPSSPYFGEPEYYLLTAKQGGVNLKIHPSRVVRFVGAEAADPNITDGWGDSILQVCADAIIACGVVAQSSAQLVSEAKLDIIKVPELTTKVTTAAYKEKLSKRFAIANSMKSVYHTLILDKEEEWTRIEQNFGGLPEMLKMYLLICTGALDIPATRFLGQSPQGLNATGESDTRNYYDRIATEQKINVEPELATLDRLIMRSAFGAEPEGLHYNWNSLWQMSDAEKSDIALKQAQTMKLDVDAALISPETMRRARENQLIETGTYPGLEIIIAEEEAGGDLPTDLPTLEPTAPTPSANPLPSTGNVVAPQPVQHSRRNDSLRDTLQSQLRRMQDASRPRTLYVRRDVLNKAAITTWAKSQGFASIITDLHVTIAFSRQPVDWLKAGEAWMGEGDSMTIRPGGPRVVERFGKAVVLGFANTNLQYRHCDIRERTGASWDFDDYTPHVSITYADSAALLLDTITPYHGEIVLGPEIFEEVNENWNETIKELTL